MKRRCVALVCLSLLLACGAAAQDGYLDVYIVKVKPEKRADFDAVVKKMVDANRRNNGDQWIAAETVYGEQNVISFTSVRQDYAAVEKGFAAFEGALQKAYGPAGAGKVFQDFNNCVTSSRAEMRRRRMDLSYKAPSDAAPRNQLVGEARYYRSVAVRVRPGHAEHFEELVRMLNRAREKAGSKGISLVSQSATGQTGAMFWFSSLQRSMAGFDPTGPAFREMMGDDYEKWNQGIAESTFGSETYINRFLPELSNAPEEIASVSPAFWRPKPAAAAKPKAAEKAGAPAAKKAEPAAKKQ